MASSLNSLVSNRPATDAAVPLTILEAVQFLDAPIADGLNEFHRELAVKRLGMSETVAAQIDRYRRLAWRGRRVDAEEVAALFRLVGRRSDAGLVFADAGRRAGRRAVKSLSGPAALAWRGLPDFARNAFGFALARRAVRLLDAVMQREAGLPSAVIANPPSAAATPAGAGCGFYGSAIAEILRALTTFDGAMLHVRCRARGDEVCQWRAATA
ncbi:MAG: hypothetical protein HY560_05805, partial [Gemmatimonadetes bacterium]|nr:hypothetical protein [Gemmatimonadota bacterium]